MSFQRYDMDEYALTDIETGRTYLAPCLKKSANPVR
jgi:hypothetical protein